ncbi:hypothetical protein M8PIadj_0877 [Bifidobacterium animalis]|nr:hypothetical protein M8PIadj_0877 [Bifidobacterium animalis]
MTFAAFALSRLAYNPRCMWPYSKKDLLAIHRKEDHHVNVAA